MLAFLLKSWLLSRREQVLCQALIIQSKRLAARHSSRLECYDAPLNSSLIYDKKVLSMTKMLSVQHFERKKDRGWASGCAAKCAQEVMTMRGGASLPSLLWHRSCLLYVAAEVQGAAGDVCATVDRSIIHG